MSVVGAYRAVEGYLHRQGQRSLQTTEDVEALLALLRGQSVTPEDRERALSLLRDEDPALASELEQILVAKGEIPPAMKKVLNAFVEDQMRGLADAAGQLAHQEQMHQTLLLPVKKVMDAHDQAVSTALRNLIA